MLESDNSESCSRRPLSDGGVSRENPRAAKFACALRTRAASSCAVRWTTTGGRVVGVVGPVYCPCSSAVDAGRRALVRTALCIRASSPSWTGAGNTGNWMTAGFGLFLGLLRTTFGENFNRSRVCWSLLSRWLTRSILSKGLSRSLLSGVCDARTTLPPPLLASVVAV